MSKVALERECDRCVGISRRCFLTWLCSGRSVEDKRGGWPVLVRVGSMSRLYQYYRTWGWRPKKCVRYRSVMQRFYGDINTGCGTERRRGRGTSAISIVLHSCYYRKPNDVWYMRTKMRFTWETSNFNEKLLVSSWNDITRWLVMQRFIYVYVCVFNTSNQIHTIDSPCISSKKSSAASPLLHMLFVFQ